MGTCPACAADHCHPTKPTLLDLEVKSIAQAQIFTRLIVRHKEIGLSQKQLEKILTLYEKYRNDYSALAAKARLSADDVLNEIYEFPMNRTKVTKILKERAAIFTQHEMLYVNVVGNMRKILSSSQYTKLCRVYVEERRQQIKPLKSSISEALRPVFEVSD